MFTICFLIYNPGDGEPRPCAEFHLTSWISLHHSVLFPLSLLFAAGTYTFYIPHQIWYVVEDCKRFSLFFSVQSSTRSVTNQGETGTLATLGFSLILVPLREIFRSGRPLK